MEELIERFDAGLDALERGHLDRFMDELGPTFHPEVEFTSIIGSAVEGAPYKGPEGIRSWFSELLGTTEHVRWTNREFRMLGDRVILFLAQFEIQGASSGAVLTTEIGTVFEIEDGLSRRAHTYGSQAEAIAAADQLVGAGA